MRRAAAALIDVADPGALSERDFRRLCDLLQAQAGIELAPEKHALVVNRLHRRVVALGLPGFRAYVDLVVGPDAGPERQTVVDLLTTNETYFFREPEHFQFLRQWVANNQRPTRSWRVWSAACSSGEEPYSIAMTLADVLGPERWEVIGSDISRRMLERAGRGHYPLARLENFPTDYLRRFCWKGIGPQAGTLLVDREVRRRVSFRPINFVEPLPELGSFDVIFLRNALIYFRQEAKQAIVRQIEQRVAPGGYLIVSHSESLFGLTRLEAVKPSIYRRPA